MGQQRLSEQQKVMLRVLTNGVIPADETDGGAAEVNAGDKLAEKIENGIAASLYMDGLNTASAVAAELFGATAGVQKLSNEQVHEWLTALKMQAAPFYKQLRTDVAALYLSDPGVLSRIAFPGPSAQYGGYADDFDQPQKRTGKI